MFLHFALSNQSKFSPGGESPRDRKFKYEDMYMSIIRLIEPGMANSSRTALLAWRKEYMYLQMFYSKSNHPSQADHR